MNARVNTVEHTLAALVGLEIDNVLIQLDGPETSHIGWKLNGIHRSLRKSWDRRAERTEKFL